MKFLNQNCNLLIPRTSKLPEKPSALKIEPPALQKTKYYCFLFFWVILAVLDPDPGTPLNPDPQHCQKLLERNQLVPKDITGTNKCVRKEMGVEIRQGN